MSPSPRDAYDDLTGRGRSSKPVRSARQVDALVRGGVEEVVRRLQLRTWQVLTSATPVDTGFARANWTPTVGSPISERRDQPASATEARSQARSGLPANRARAEQIAQSYLLMHGRVFIVNPVPYVVYLNEGSSSQAPAKFVERGIGQAIRSLSR